MSDGTVPKDLAEELIGAAGMHGNTTPHLRIAMAYPIIFYYLGNPWYKERACLSDDPDPFMLNERDEEGENRWVYQDRLVGLADALFQLRDCKNFDALRERFWERETKPCFTEATIAKNFSSGGFEVEIVRESGVKGEDFDFVARKGSLEITVEVTAKEATKLTAETVRNSLKKKRKQVPGDRPAILYVIIPEKWTENGDDAYKILSNAVEDHFRSSKTFTAICFVWYAKVNLGGGRIFALTYHPFEHPSPRFPVENLKFLRPNNPLGDLNTVRERAAIDSNGLKQEIDEGCGDTPPSFESWYVGVTKSDR